jgi:threonine dehydrogenase-like Zn-dependent dehydrogenase
MKGRRIVFLERGRAAVEELLLLAAGRMRTRPLISEQVRPDAAPSVYRRLMDREPDLLGVVFRWRDMGAHQ